MCYLCPEWCEVQADLGCFIGLKGLKSLAQGFNHISANLLRGASIVEWFSSRRDSTIVARHEMPE
jgi:hypothetical protein